MSRLIHLIFRFRSVGRCGVLLFAQETQPGRGLFVIKELFNTI